MVETKLIGISFYKYLINEGYYFNKEIIENYRKEKEALDIMKLQEYIAKFPKQNHILNTIQLEVF